MRINLFEKSVGLVALATAIALGAPLGARAMDEKAGAAEKAAIGETQAAEQPLASVPSSNPLSGKPEDIAAGRKLYFTWCTQCHGPKANGESRFGSYAADLRKFWRGYREFVVIVQNGRTARQMPPWKEVLSEQQISQVGAYLETLAIEGAIWK